MNETLTAVFNVEELTEEGKARLASYLEAFHEPEPEGDRTPCAACGMDIRATFQWGLAHGSGGCTNCGWPVRWYHYLDLGHGEKLTRYPLAYRAWTEKAGEGDEIDPKDWYEEKKQQEKDQ